MVRAGIPGEGLWQVKVNWWTESRKTSVRILDKGAVAAPMPSESPLLEIKMPRVARASETN